MAKEFLHSHGIDLDAEMSRIQSEAYSTTIAQTFPNSHTQNLTNISLPRTAPGTRWELTINTSGKITSIIPHATSSSRTTTTTNNSNNTQPGREEGEGGALLTPSLTHPHIHLDKAFLLPHPKYAHLPVRRGDFQEAMELTTTAKSLFERGDLLERGRRVLDESIHAGVTAMRAFVEVDAGVGEKCLNAGVELKAEARGRCEVQLCAFAQLALFSPSAGDEAGEVIRGLMRDAAGREEVDVVGSTPYVEGDRGRMERNVEWTVELSGEMDVHLDFHLDYHLDPAVEPLVWFVLRTLKARRWRERTKGKKTVVLGHCTRLTLFTPSEWRQLRDEIGDLPISFVGLPTSDLFMMRTENQTRGTLDIPALIKEYGFNACIGINNIGNAFTPHGSCDPLTLACHGVGVYQAGTEGDAEVLFECVSTRARRAIGMEKREWEGDKTSVQIKVGDPADLVLFGTEKEEWRTRKNVAEAVYLYDRCRGRRAFLGGVLTNGE